MSQHSCCPPKGNAGKTNWMLIGSAIILIFIIGAFAVSSSKVSNRKESKSSGLVATEAFFDFGSISMAQGNVSKVFTFINATDQPIVINKIYTSCMCTQATLIQGDSRQGPFGMPGHGAVPTIKETVAPGAEAKIEAVFDPAAHGPSGVGSVQRIIYVESEDEGKLSLEFKANVRP